MRKWRLMFMSLSQCKFCLKEKQLIKAHIIPKWAFSYLYPENEDNRIPLMLASKDGQVRRPIGPYDMNILCGECDNLLGKYDNYAKNIFIDGKLEERGEAAYLIKDVDFKKLQLFLLSVVWRASISGSPEFERISLGVYEERIREILISQESLNPVPLFNYQFVVTKFEEGNLPFDVVNKTIQIPHTQKISGVNVAVLYFPRALKVYLKLDKRKFEGSIEKVAIYQKEGLIIAKAGVYEKSDEFKAMVNII